MVTVPPVTFRRMGNLSIDPRVVQMIRNWILEQQRAKVTPSSEPEQADSLSHISTPI